MGWDMLGEGKLPLQLERKLHQGTSDPITEEWGISFQGLKSPMYKEANQSD